MGLGGDVTVLSVHVEHADTHMTLNPVAVNYQCWAARRARPHRRRRTIKYEGTHDDSHPACSDLYRPGLT